MLRRAVRLQKTTFSEVIRIWLAGQPQRMLWHSSSLWCNKPPDSDESSSSSSSSSDSDSDTEKPGSGVDERLQEAVKGVGQAIPGHGHEVQSELLRQLQSFAKVSKDQAAGIMPPKAKSASQISDLLSGMQIQKPQARGSTELEDTMYERPKLGQVAGRQTAVRRQQQQRDREKVKLFEGQSLGIFTSAEPEEASHKQDTEGQRVSLWEQVQKEQLEMHRRQPPSNAFEEMIQWTKEGKLWQFPINNEQGLEEEAKVGFHQHVFLEDQIQDFPRRGPIRHFMELVIIGLAKNPHLTVQQKHEHIDWFRQYFKEKQDILQEALGNDGLLSEASA